MVLYKCQLLIYVFCFGNNHEIVLQIAGGNGGRGGGGGGRGGDIMTDRVDTSFLFLFFA